MGSVRVTTFSLPNRPKWFPTTTRTARMPSPMCPRLLGYTRYLPRGPPALLPSCLLTTVAFAAAPLSPSPLPLLCLSTPSELVSPRANLCLPAAPTPR